MTDRIPRNGRWPHPDAPGVYVLVDEHGQEYLCGSKHIGRHLQNPAFALAFDDEQRAPQRLLRAWRRGTFFTAHVLEICDEDQIAEIKNHLIAKRRPFYNIEDGYAGEENRDPERVEMFSRIGRATHPGRPRDIHEVARLAGTDLSGVYKMMRSGLLSSPDVDLGGGRSGWSLAKLRPRTALDVARILNTDWYGLRAMIERGTFPRPDAVLRNGGEAWTLRAISRIGGAMSNSNQDRNHRAMRHERRAAL